MDHKVFYEVLVPLMEVKGTATICISTPLGSSNFYSELTRVKDEKGRPIFNVLQIGHSMRPEWKPLETYSTVRSLSSHRFFAKRLQGKSDFRQQYRNAQARNRRRDHRRRGRRVQEAAAQYMVHETAYGAARGNRQQLHIRRGRPERRREQNQHARLRYGDCFFFHHKRLCRGKRVEILYFGCASSGSWEMYSATSVVIQT